MAYILLLQFFLLATLATGATIPSRLQKCDRKQSDFDQCLAKAIGNAASQSAKPIKELGLPSMDPLYIPEMTIGAGSGPVGFEQKFTNLNVSGYVDGVCSKAHMDFEKLILSLTCSTPKLTLDFDYDINGKLLVFPITGKGVGKIELTQLQADITFNLKEYDKNGKKHYKVENFKESLTPKHIRFRLDNLFNGDKTLGDNINKVLNENWESLFEDAKSGYEDAFASVYASLFDRVAERVSVNDLFGSP